MRGQTTYVLAGTVHDASGARIGSARIAASSDAGVAVETSTDGQGEFRTNMPQAGTYRVRVTREGFKPLTATAVLSESSPSVHLDLTMEIEGHSETTEGTSVTLVIAPKIESNAKSRTEQAEVVKERESGPGCHR